MCAWCLKMLSLCAHWVLKPSKCLWALLAPHSHFPVPRSHFHSCCDSASNRPQSTMTPHRTQTHRQRERRMRGKPLGGSERNFKGEINCRGTLHCESDMKNTPSRIWDLFLSPPRSLSNSVSRTHICHGSQLVTWLWVSDMNFFSFSFPIRRTQSRTNPYERKITKDVFISFHSHRQ